MTLIGCGTAGGRSLQRRAVPPLPDRRSHRSLHVHSADAGNRHWARPTHVGSPWEWVPRRALIGMLGTSCAGTCGMRARPFLLDEATEVVAAHLPGHDDTSVASVRELILHLAARMSAGFAGPNITGLVGRLEHRTGCSIAELAAVAATWVPTPAHRPPNASESGPQSASDVASGRADVRASSADNS